MDQSVFIKHFPIFFQCGTFINIRTGRLNFALFFFRFLTNILILTSTIYCSSSFNQDMIFKTQDMFPALMFVLMDALIAKDRMSLFSLLGFLSEPIEVDQLKPRYLKVVTDYNRIIYRISQTAASIFLIGSLTWAFFPLPYLLKLNIQEVIESDECFHLSFGWIPTSFVSLSVIAVATVISGIMCILNTLLIFAWSLQLLFTVLKVKVELEIICSDILSLGEECKEKYANGMLQSSFNIPLCKACLSSTYKESINPSKLKINFLNQYEVLDMFKPRECCWAALKEKLLLGMFKRRFEAVINRHTRIINLVRLANKSFNLQVMMFCQLAVPVGALIIANTESNLSAIEYFNRGIHIAGVFNLSAHYNYCGQILLNESEHLREVLYGCEWIGKPREIQQIIIIMQSVANRPLRLTSGGLYTLSLESYTKVLSAVYSYTNVLQSLRNKNVEY